MARIRSLQSVIALRWRRSAFALYAASFLFNLAGGILWIAWSWRVKALGGDALAVGLVGGVWMGGFILFCLLVGPHADRLGPRRLVMAAAVATTCIIALMPMAPFVWLLLVLVGLTGAAAGLFWPPIAGWVSVGHEGKRLNRRLGMFNISWALGAVAGPWLGGRLWNIHHDWTFVAALGAALGAFLVAAGARKSHAPPARPKPTGIAPKPTDDGPPTAVFHLMALVAGITAGIASGVIRYPIVSLMDSLRLGPDAHGIIGTGMNLAVMCSLHLMGRTTRWHYRRALLWGSQIVMAAALCAVGFSNTRWELVIYTFIATLCTSAVYASDLYYSVSGSTRRAASVAWREMRGATGFVIGSFGGGALVRIAGLRGIYPIMAAIIAAALLVQVAIYYRTRLREA